MQFTAGEAARRLGVSKDTLYYYEKEGLLPTIQRDAANRRVYTQTDIEWIFLIRCLRDTDMPICKIREYVALLQSGNPASIQARRRLLDGHRRFIQEKMAAYQSLLRLIEKKLHFYDAALASPESVQCGDYASEWRLFKSIYKGGTKDD